MATFSSKVKMWKRSEEKILTPRALRWLHDHGDFTVSDEHVPELLRIVQSGSNQIRHGRFGASSRGTCKRAQVFQYLGVSGIPLADPVLSNVFLDGTWRHVRWQMLGLEQGWFSRVEVGGAVPELRLGVSADAVNDDEGWGFELKGTSQLASIIRNGVPESHMLQIHTMMLAFEMDRWVYLAEDKSRQELHEVVVERDPKITHAVMEELDELSSAIDGQYLPEVLPACRGGDGRPFTKCQYRSVCLNFDCASVAPEQWVQSPRVDGRA